ncbi:MOSC domain-containing protein [Hydrocarboniphaga sp.]|uniref:MOSC domain-containing protein n=1 Tax=Hydrocarboniphaga sp. TaxID=2033016 RepID=UPI003D0F40FC
MPIRLTALHIYPIKSCAALAPSQIDLEARGLAHDRRWMIVDASKRFITGREQPRLVLIRAEPTPRGLLLRAPSMPDLLVPPPRGRERVDATVWRNVVDAAVASDEANAWVSRFLRSDCKLVHMDIQASRPVDPDHAQPGDEVSFADAYPLLLISQGSLEGLNAKLQAPVSMLRFRPNLVVDGVPAHAEDGWKRLRIGNIVFELVKPCVRCGFTTVVPETGMLDPGGEPLRTLTKYRRGVKGVVFGMNVIARGCGRLSVGDSVEVLQ